MALPSQCVLNIDLDLSVLQGNEGRSVAGDAATLPFRSDTFDGAPLKDVLEHVKDSVAVLSELARVARLDARMIVRVPRAIPRCGMGQPNAPARVH